VGVPEGDVFEPDRGGVGFGVARFGVLSDPQQIVEGYVGEVSSGLCLGTAWGVGPVGVQEVLCKGNWDC
jgi:hypothetical protein